MTVMNAHAHSLSLSLSGPRIESDETQLVADRSGRRPAAGRPVVTPVVTRRHPRPPWLLTEHLLCVSTVLLEGHIKHVSLSSPSPQTFKASPSSTEKTRAEITRYSDSKRHRREDCAGETPCHSSPFARVKHNMLLIFKDAHISGSREIGFVCFNRKAIIFLLKRPRGLQDFPPRSPRRSGTRLGRGTPLLTY